MTPVKIVIVSCFMLFLNMAMCEKACAGDNSATCIFNEKVRTLQAFNTSMPAGFTGIPVLTGVGDETLIIEFDHLATDREYLRYNLVHCDSQWRPDGLAYIEYLDGFNEGIVEDYLFSEATSVPYVHYRIELPNSQVRPLISGNYLLKVYPEGDEDDVWLQCRFAVSEQTASLGVNISGRTDVDYNRAHQQLEVSANVERADVRDVFNDLTLVIEQNGRNDNKAVLTKPLKVSGGTLYYEHMQPLIFPAGNEYRRFETVSKRYSPMGVETVDYMAPYYRYTLNMDTPRSNMSYLYDRTLGGGYIIRDADNDTRVDDSDVTADYAVVQFSLEMPQLYGYDVFIDGDMSCRQFSPESAMTYNNATGCYEKAMLLKQGAYSYQYLAVKHGDIDGRGQTGLIEGDHFETQNRYTIYLYNKRPGERYDRLVGYTTIVAQ